MTANLFRLDGRVALVTGSTSGIGLALARGLAGAGAQVVLNCNVPGELDAAAAQLRAEGLAAHTSLFDVSDSGAVADARHNILDSRPDVPCHAISEHRLDLNFLCSIFVFH